MNEEDSESVLCVLSACFWSGKIMDLNSLSQAASLAPSSCESSVLAPKATVESVQRTAATAIICLDILPLCTNRRSEKCLANHSDYYMNEASYLI
jgi:hypothetical protein